MNNLRKQVMERFNDLDNMTDLYSAPMAITLPPLFNSPRKAIYGHNISHAVVITEPDVCHMYTGFEKVLGKYSEMYREAKEDMIVINKFQRNKYHYLLLVYKPKEKVYDVLSRVPLEEFSEGYCAKYNNKFLDSLEIGDKILKNETYIKSTSFDEHNNYRISKELNTLYMISTSTEEDCAHLMNGAEKMMDTYRSHTIKVPINRDEVILNLYGKGKKFKGFPVVGEKIENGILISTRKIQNDSVLYSGKDKHMNRLTHGDVTRYQSGKVYDINIYHNIPISEFPESPIYDQLRVLAKEQNDFYYLIYEELSKILDSSGDSYTCGDMVHYWINRAAKFIDPSAYFIDGESVFGNIILEFKILERQQLLPGSKLTGYDGNKGVVGHISSKKHSLRTESGRPVHIIVDMLGVTGRINIGQLFKPYGNYVSLGVRNKIAELAKTEYKTAENILIDHTVKTISSLDNAEEGFKILKKFFKIIDTPDADYIVEYFDSLTDKKKIVFMNKVLAHGIYVMQDPSLPTSLEQWEEATVKYDIKPERIVFPDGSKSLRRVVVAPAPWIRLKQDPIDKYSARGE